MPRRAVFLDLDGTYLNEVAQVPASAREAVESARANGHLVFVCTGRLPNELWPEILEAGFDGIIASSGAHIEIEGQIVSQPPLTLEDLGAALEYLDAHGVDYYLNAASGTYPSPRFIARARELLIGPLTDPAHIALAERALAKHQAIMVLGADLLRDDVTKICFLDSGLPRQQIDDALGDRFEVTGTTVVQFGPNSGELLAKGSGKVPAIQAVLAQFGVPVEDSIAYGDGLNDLEMLRFVHIGVAMGNAHPHLKEAADSVTGTPDEHGIRSSFEALGLI